VTVALIGPAEEIEVGWMRLALNLRYLGPLGTASRPKDFAEYAREAERLGFSVVWVAEAFSSDVPSLLGWIAADTGPVSWSETEQSRVGRQLAEMCSRVHHESSCLEVHQPAHIG